MREFLQELNQKFQTVGIILLIVLPSFQFLESKVRGIRGDGVVVYGQNIFASVLGVKTIFYSQDGLLADRLGTELQTPPWMQRIGLPNSVSWGWKKEQNLGFPYENSAPSQVISVIILRWIIKLIPLYIFLLGMYGEKKE